MKAYFIRELGPQFQLVQDSYNVGRGSSRRNILFHGFPSEDDYLLVLHTTKHYEGGSSAFEKVFEKGRESGEFRCVSVFSGKSFCPPTSSQELTALERIALQYQNNQFYLFDADKKEVFVYQGEGPLQGRPEFTLTRKISSVRLVPSHTPGLAEISAQRSEGFSREILRKMVRAKPTMDPTLREFYEQEIDSGRDLAAEGILTGGQELDLLGRRRRKTA